MFLPRPQRRFRQLITLRAPCGCAWRLINALTLRALPLCNRFALLPALLRSGNFSLLKVLWTWGPGKSHRILRTRRACHPTRTFRMQEGMSCAAAALTRFGVAAVISVSYVVCLLCLILIRG